MKVALTEIRVLAAGGLRGWRRDPICRTRPKGPAINDLKRLTRNTPSRSTATAERIAAPNGRRLWHSVRFPALVLAVWLASAAAASAQQTIHVCNGGVCSPGALSTIQAGINAASDGDTVQVAPGTYPESVDFKGKAITVASSGSNGNTVIDGTGFGYAVVFQTNETRASVLRGFTIRGGGSMQTAPVFGGVAISGASPTITGNIITSNFCYGINSQSGAPLIQANTVTSTQDVAGKCSTALQPGTSETSGKTISNGGAGILLNGNSQPLDQQSFANGPVVVGNVIENNTVPGTGLSSYAYGGAGIVDASNYAVIENNLLQGNTVGNGVGGAIEIGFSNVGGILAQNLIDGNTAGCNGGGVAINAVYGGANDGGANDGGANDGGANDAIDPGFDAEPPQFFFVNNTIVGNTVAGSCAGGGGNVGEGSQLFVQLPDASVELANNIVVGASSRSAVYCQPGGNGLAASAKYDPNLFLVDHNDFFNSGGAAYGGGCASQTGSFGNLSADPLFANAAGADYHLLPGSPAIDSGNNSALAQLATNGFGLTDDFADNGASAPPRVQDATGLGYPVVDMGAYESAGAAENGATTLALTPSAYEVTLHAKPPLTAQIRSPNGTPTGSVSFFEDGALIGTSTIAPTADPNTGTASIVAGAQSAPSHSFFATYAGQGGFSPAISVRVSEFVALAQPTIAANSIPTTVALASSLNPANSGQPVTFTATVSATPRPTSGIVVFTNTDANGVTTQLASVPLVNGSTTSVIAYGLPKGTNTVKAVYQPSNSDYASGSASLPEVINGLPSATALTVAPTAPYALEATAITATVTGQDPTPTGTVTFANQGATIGTATLNSAGVATIAYAFPAAGAQSIVATYNADATYNASVSAPVAVQVGINASQTTLSVTPSPTIAFETTTLTARVSVLASIATNLVPSGTVNFFDGATSLGTATLNSVGVATLAVASFQTGTHSITAVFPATSALQGSTSAPFPLVVTADPTATALSTAPNPAEAGASVLLNAAVSALGAPVGQVNFFDGATPLGSAQIDQHGNASMVISTLAAGIHPITASFAGSLNFLPSVSAVVEETIVAYLGDFSIHVSPGSASVYTGQATPAFAVSLSPTGGWDRDVTLSCSGLPANTSCAFGSAIVAGANGATSLVIQTSAPQRAGASQSGGLSWPGKTWPGKAGAALASLALLVLPFRRRGAGLWALALLAGLGAFGALNGCGAAPVVGGTPPGTYNISINATFSEYGQTLTRSGAVKLDVKSLF